MPKGQFDAEGFCAALDSQRQAKRLTWKKVAAQAGVSASTRPRMAQGRRPDVDTMAALLAWSGLKADRFVMQTSRANKEGETEPLAEITAYLRADSNLSTDAALALEAVLKAAYEQLRKN